MISTDGTGGGGGTRVVVGCNLFYLCKKKSFFCSELPTTFFYISLRNRNIRFCRMPSSFCTSLLLVYIYFSSILSANFFINSVNKIFLSTFSTNFFYPTSVAPIVFLMFLLAPPPPPRYLMVWPLPCPVTVDLLPYLWPIIIRTPYSRDIYACSRQCNPKFTSVRDLVKLNKSKNSRKTRIGQTPLTNSRIHFLFFVGNMYNNNKNIQKHKISKKYEIRVGSWPTHPPPSFSQIFFNLTKPLRSYDMKYM